MLTGERADDEVAAAYYLPTTRQEPHHTFPIDDGALPTKSGTTPEEDVTTTYSFQIDAATLTAWTASDGWADPGQAWLVVDWTYTVTAAHPVISGRIDRFDAALEVTAGDEVVEDTVHDEDKGGDVTGTKSTSVAVPIETTDVAVSVSGGAEIDMYSGSGLEMAGSRRRPSSRPTRWRSPSRANRRRTVRALGSDTVDQGGGAGGGKSV